MDADIAIVKQATESIAVQQITGATLLGVFASGDVSGVIVAEKGTRRRLVEGELLQGWELTSVEPRGAVFTAGVRMARLDMQVLNNGPTPSAERSASPTEVGGEKRSNADEEASQETKLTFVPVLKRCINPKRGPLKPAQMQRLLSQPPVKKVVPKMSRQPTKPGGHG